MTQDFAERTRGAEAHPCRASPASATPHSEGPICWRLGDLCQMSRRSVTLQSLEEARTALGKPGQLQGWGRAEQGPRWGGRPMSL